MRQLKDLFQMMGPINKSIFTVLRLLLISIMSFAGCGGEGDTIYVNNVSEDSSSSSIVTEEESSSSSGTITEEESSSSGISSIGESNSSSSGVKPIQEAYSSSSSSAIVSDGTCDSLITPFTRTYNSYIRAIISDTSTTGVLVLEDSTRETLDEITLEVRKDSIFFSSKEYNFTNKYRNVTCETFDGELRIYSEGLDSPRLISDLNGVWDMFGHKGDGKTAYDVMGDSPYINSSYWEQD